MSTATAKKANGNVPKPAQPTTGARVSRFAREKKIKVIGDKIPVRANTQRASIFGLFKKLEGKPLTDFLLAARKLRGGDKDVEIAINKKYITLVG